MTLLIAQGGMRGGLDDAPDLDGAWWYGPEPYYSEEVGPALDDEEVDPVLLASENKKPRGWKSTRPNIQDSFNIVSTNTSTVDPQNLLLYIEG